MYLHVVRTLVAEKPESFVQQLACKGIVLLIASSSRLIEHAFPESVMSAKKIKNKIHNISIIVKLCQRIREGKG